MEGSAMCGWYGYDSMANGGCGGWEWGDGIMTAMGVIGFLVLMINVVVAVVRYLTRGGHHRDLGNTQPGRTSEDVLAERFARSEIDDDEYRRRMAVLNEHR